MTKRKRVFSIVTEKLSDDVYNVLEAKSKQKKLTEYIEELVIRDQYPSVANAAPHVERQYKEIKTMLELIMSRLDAIETAGSHLVANEHSDSNETKRKREEELTEGLLVQSTVTGSLDEEDLEDYDF
jgi:hypothetical protein